MSEDLTEPRRYRSDDRDLGERNDTDLMVYQGGNGDWYLTIVPHGQHIGPTVRLTTSGVPRGCEGVPVALARLFRALPVSPNRTVATERK